MMEQSRKAVTAAVAITMTILAQHYGLSLPGIEGPVVELVMSAIVGAIGVWSVWRVPNKPA